MASHGASQRWPRPLKEVAIHSSTVSYATYLWRVSRSNRHGGLIAFAGTYRPGSAGTDDAWVVKRRTEDFIDHGAVEATPWGVIVDLRELSYTWGDDLNLPAPERSYVPVRVLVRDDQLEAYSGALGADAVRTDVEDLFREMSDIIRALRV